MRLGLFLIIDLFNPLLCHSNDYVSLFVTTFNILVCLNDLFQGIASINDRFQLSSLSQLCQEAQMCIQSLSLVCLPFFDDISTYSLTLAGVLGQV
jgi:hypothetical protein